VDDNGTRKYKVLCKGAPEAVEKLLSKVPENYRLAYEFYTKQGYRLLALASK
jgi:magnesium-transporting ATPase (P-type)